jgi:CheY-like chemotaxis protein/anti-sigma regulatory factor (Ser/Thr protein kinase)
LSGRHLLGLLNDILDVAKAAANRLELEYAPFDVRLTLENCIHMIREDAAREGLAVQMGVDDGVGTIEADERRVAQVVLNLLTNAVKFSRTRIDVHASSSGSTLTVLVSDDGPGITPEDQSLIFETFEQGKRRPLKERGNGLGLAISRKLAEMHGGTLTVESELDRGSTFTFAIPIEPSRQSTAVSPVEMPTPLSGPVVVVVEDDPRSRELLCLHVKRLGVDYVTAGDGRQGLELIRSVSPAAVVLDIKLPVLDGWDLLGVLKADPTTAKIPVVVVSMLDERGKGLALGAAEYLVKPVRGDDVRAALARVTGLPANGEKLVFVGEDAEVLELLRTALEPEGWIVLGASTEKEGLALLHEAHPAVMLLDLLGKGASGLPMVDSVRRDPSTSGLPIIALTSRSMTAEEKERLQGQIELVNRSTDFDVSALVDVVNRALQRFVTSEGS